MDIGYIDAITKYYPSKIVSLAGSDLFNYNGIVWNDGIPIAKEELDQKMVDLLKIHVSEHIRREATEQRMFWQEYVLGSSDKYQERTYDEKYIEAKNYVADNNSPTPIMSAEVAHTGELIADLAVLVIQQYESAKNFLWNKYGDIEGRRRKQLADVQLLTTITELRNFTITWG